MWGRQRAVDVHGRGRCTRMHVSNRSNIVLEDFCVGPTALCAPKGRGCVVRCAPAPEAQVLAGVAGGRGGLTAASVCLGRGACTGRAAHTRGTHRVPAHMTRLAHTYTTGPCSTCKLGRSPSERATHLRQLLRGRRHGCLQLLALGLGQGDLRPRPSTGGQARGGLSGWRRRASRRDRLQAAGALLSRQHARRATCSPGHHLAATSPGAHQPCDCRTCEPPACPTHVAAHPNGHVQVPEHTLRSVTSHPRQRRGFGTTTPHPRPHLLLQLGLHSGPGLLQLRPPPRNLRLLLTGGRGGRSLRPALRLKGGAVGGGAMQSAGRGGEGVVPRGSGRTCAGGGGGAGRMVRMGGRHPGQRWAMR